MALIAYPADLPCPRVAPIQRYERRQLSALPGPRQSRVLQRDKYSTQTLEFICRTPTQMQAWLDWYRAILGDGAHWFAAEWPQPEGGTGVRRFVGAPVYAEVFRPRGGWRIQIECRVRGRGELPKTPSGIVNWNPATSDTSYGDQTGWVIDGPHATILGFFNIPAQTRMTLFAERFVSSGKVYFEIEVDDTSSSDADHIIGKLGVCTVNYADHWHDPINGVGGGAEELADGDRTPLANAYRPTWSSHCIIQVALDLDAGVIWFGKNNVWHDDQDNDPVAGIKPCFAGIVGPVTPFVRYFAVIMNSDLNLRTTTPQFTYAPPAGFLPYGD